MRLACCSGSTAFVHVLLAANASTPAPAASSAERCTVIFYEERFSQVRLIFDRNSRDFYFGAKDILSLSRSGPF
jgi:hypothetical protein